MDENKRKASAISKENNLPTYPSYPMYSNQYNYGSMGWNNVGYGAAYEERGTWRKLYDFQSGYWYYQNISTNTTQWEEPEGWATLPLNGQESQEDDKEEELDVATKLRKTSEEIETKNTRYLKRPARRQVDPEDAKKIHWRPEGANEYNIWYDKYIGDHWNQSKNDGPAETRCCVNKDAGCTKATLHDPHHKKNYFCTYFARGCCHLGPDCGFRHLVPTDKDEKRIDLIHDIFGREKHKAHSDNMGGVGSFEKDCRTLYVGRLGNNQDIETALWTEFGEWGEIEDIRVIKKRQIAFVRYKNRVNCEFAKIAMSDQKLEGRGILNVRWAYDDPNPKARIQKAEEIRDTVRSVVYAKLDEEPQPKRLCSTGIVGRYPNTDDQYPNMESAASIGPQTEEQIEQEKIAEQAKQDWSRLDQVFQRLESNT